jgi:HAD domain in Swiss Army Knife RNA repair proteins
LLTAASWRRRQPIDPRGVAALHTIIEATGAAIVVISAWRSARLRPIRDLLASWGVKGKVIGMTPRLESLTNHSRGGRAATRGEDIQVWLKRYQARHGPIEAFVIVDDDAEGLDALADRLIQPACAAGLTAEHARHAMARLSQSRDGLTVN